MTLSISKIINARVKISPSLFGSVVSAFSIGSVGGSAQPQFFFKKKEQFETLQLIYTEMKSIQEKFYTRRHIKRTYMDL